MYLCVAVFETENYRGYSVFYCGDICGVKSPDPKYYVTHSPVHW